MNKYIELKEKYKNKKIILHVASYLSPMKGTEYAIEAMGYVNEEYPDALLIIINSHNDKQRQYELSTLAMQCRARIEFITEVKDKDMPAYYSIAKCLLAPSLDENVHLPVLESQACETPVISLKGNQDSEEVEQFAGLAGKGVYISKELAFIVGLYLSSEEQSRNHGKNARKFVIDNFSWDNAARGYKKLIDEVTSVKV